MMVSLLSGLLMLTVVCFFSFFMSATPLAMVLAFMVMIMSSAFLSFMFMTELLVYLLFLVYMGGLLVLVTYMIIMSSNWVMEWSVTNKKMLVLGGVFMMVVVLMYNWISFNHSEVFKCQQYTPMDLSCIILLGLLLLYVFTNICNLLFKGGRTFTVGKNT
uniref:NADH dehydrogenase subunit 6 n=1 Tax=Camaena poyuensis TaxID=1708535 RepID=A0A1S5PLV3_9EUPU|nr:NADH dehydrogenase subunit 6 [Camaena poyuensis]